MKPWRKLENIDWLCRGMKRMPARMGTVRTERLRKPTKVPIRATQDMEAILAMVATTHPTAIWATTTTA